MSHTPGPWEFDGDYVWADAISGCVADPQTEDMRSGDSVPHREAPAVIQANGHLIAAAPDLLEACLLFARWAQATNDFRYPPGSLQQLHAAIAKATRTAA